MKYAGILVCVAMALGCCGFGGTKVPISSSQPSETGKDKETGNPKGVDVGDFVAKPASYKGKRLTLTLKVGDIRGSLRDYRGRDAQFLDAANKLDMRIAIPHDLEVPGAGASDSVVVTFDCNSGSLEYNNLAMKIERP